MRWYRNMKIGTKLLVVMLLLSMIPLVSVGVLSFLQAQNALTEAAYTAQDVFAEQKAFAIERWFHELLTSVRVAASTRSTYNSLNILRQVNGDVTAQEWQERITMMNDGFEVLAREQGLTFYFISDTNGRVVYANVEPLRGADLSQRDYMQAALRGQVTTSDFFYSGVVNDHVIVAVSPILSGGDRGDIVGTFAVAISEDAISSRIVEGMDAIGRTADAYLVDASGMLLSAPRFGSLRAFQDTIDTQATSDLAAHIRAGRDFGAHARYADYVGNQVLGDYEVLRLGSTPVGLIVEIDADEALAAVYALRWMVIIICVVAAAIIAIVALFFGRSFARPIGNLVQVAQTIADGDLDVNIDVNSSDEIGTLARAFARMAENVNEAMTNIDSSSEQVAAGSQQVSSASQELSQGATEQASSIEEVTASMEQLSAQTKQNAENASQANSISGEARGLADRGNRQMQNMLGAMDEINQSSSSISKIIKVIDEIAFQTNILALNAAVEAARAGQHGKGFAVVAEEVRNLAARSANAARETTDMIENSIRKVQDGTTMANETAQALASIVESVGKAAGLVETIAVASNEQAAGINQINQAIMQISDVVQTNSATAEEAAAASEELSSQAEMLKELVGKFKLKKIKSAKYNFDQLSPEILRMMEAASHKVPALTEGRKQVAAGKKKITLGKQDFGKY